MKATALIIFALSLLLSCSPHAKLLQKGATYKNFREFEPCDPVEFRDKVEIIDANGNIQNKPIKVLKKEEVLQFLNNETVLVSIGQFDTNGEISYLPVTISFKHTSYKITMDYMKFATLPQVDEENNFIGFNRVGVGLRLIALITTTEGGINIADLSSLGIAAKAGKVQGTLMIEVVGIKSKDVTTLLPLPSEINQTTIQNAMQALATIKSKLYDTETDLYPQVMAIKPNIDSCKTKRSLQDTSANAHNPTFENLDNEIKLQIGTNSIASGKSQNAHNLEMDAFNLLFDKKINEAIAKFEECDKYYPQFHSVYEIKNFLNSERNSLTNPSSLKWKEVYNTILEKYTWKLPAEIIEKLKAETE